MTPERWQQVKEIFNSAIKYEPSQRRNFLSRVCSDDNELRHEVESLIESHEKSGEFIDGLAVAEVPELFAHEKSELKPGQTVASYEIVSFISRGGMGEVYLAQDRRLNRKVALKLLPASFTKDVDRLRRFEQEARSASALNHPNIITIYEILEISSTHVIATEFVEGETLRQRLVHSQFNIHEALQISIQIADALAAAHKAGIVHRDIKPENIMLRPDGYIKVLDFGLAKLAGNASSADSAEAPTVQVRTGSGVVMGTAGYMSPEQARGLAVDARSDIFSLGALIYEMVASRKPFDGETPSDVMAAILKSEPPPLAHLVPGLPSELVRIVGKALRKDREERYQVIKDLLLDLKALKQELEFQAKLEQSVVPSSDPLSPAATHPNQQLTTGSGTAQSSPAVSSISESLSFELKRHKTGVIAALAVAVLVIAAGGFGLYKYLTRKPPVEHFWSMKISRLTNTGKSIDATISPDGKYLVYVLSDSERQSLWIRQVSNANDKEVVSPAPVGFFGITFSPDGNDLYYAIKANLDIGTLYRVPVLGGTPQKLLTGIDAPVSFSPDGKQFVLVRGSFPEAGQSALVIANADGSNEQTFVVRKSPDRFSPIFFTGPSWSPDGKWIAASVASTGGRSTLKIFNVADRSEQNLNSETQFLARVQWLPDMSGLLAIGGEHPGVAQLWFISYPEGKARRVTNDLNAYRAIGLTSDGSRLSTIQSSGIVNIWVVPNGDAKEALALRTGNIGFFASGGSSLSWLPDGRIAFASNESGSMDIWLMDADGTNRKQLTSNSGQNVNPAVSPDGSYIAYTSFRDGARTIWRVNVDGSNPQRLTNGTSDIQPSISPDGKWMVYANLTDGKPCVWRSDSDGKNPVRLTTKAASNPSISPDGQHIAFFYPEAPDPFAPPNRIAIIPSSGGEPIKIFDLHLTGTIGAVGEWSRDGKSILYLASRNNVTNVWSAPIDGRPPKQVTDFKDSLMTGFAWSHDGKQLVCTRGALLRDAVLIEDTQR
jgi:eukaryotic-like serine/threonine-protein kinase